MHDNLVEVPSEVEHQVTKATAKMNNKKVNEQFEGFLSEAVSITIKGDTPEETEKEPDYNGQQRNEMDQLVDTVDEQ